MKARTILEKIVNEKHNSERTIEIKCSGQAVEELVPLLRELKRMGSQGSSRSIKIEDWDGKNNFGFDGDGSSKIGDIVVDGSSVE